MGDSVTVGAQQQPPRDHGTQTMPTLLGTPAGTRRVTAGASTMAGQPSRALRTVCGTEQRTLKITNSLPHPRPHPWRTLEAPRACHAPFPVGFNPAQRTQGHQGPLFLPPQGAGLAPLAGHVLLPFSLPVP